ncbi:uncharacterized protein LOC144428244 [Styela clava]
MEAKLYQKQHAVTKFEEGIFKNPEIIREYIMNYLIQLDPRRKHIERYDLMLDAGCGNGCQIAMFAKHFIEIVGFDISKEQINMASKKNVYDNIQYIVGDESKMPALDNTVDLVTCSFAIQYMDVDKFVSECKRVMKWTGCAILYGYDIADIVLAPSGVHQSDSGMLAFCQYIKMSDDWFKIHAPGQYELSLRFTNVYKKLSGVQKFRNDGLVGTVTLSLEELRKYFIAIPEHNEFLNWMKIHHISDPLDDAIKQMKKMWRLENHADRDISVILKLSFFVLCFSKNDNLTE